MGISAYMILVLLKGHFEENNIKVNPSTGVWQTFYKSCLKIEVSDGKSYGDGIPIGRKVWVSSPLKIKNK